MMIGGCGTMTRDDDTRRRDRDDREVRACVIRACVRVRRRKGVERRASVSCRVVLWI